MEYVFIFILLQFNTIHLNYRKDKNIGIHTDSKQDLLESIAQNEKDFYFTIVKSESITVNVLIHRQGDSKVMMKRKDYS